MNTIGILPGNFQPPIKGHFKAYEYLKKVAGPNTFVAANDVVELPNSPLSFEDKQQIWTRHGVPIDKVVKVKDPHKAIEVTQKFGPDRTVAIFGMTAKDARKYLKNSNGYFLLFHSIEKCTEPMNKHAYVLVIPDEIIDFSALTPATFRQAFTSKKLSEEQKKGFFKRVFGWYDISLYQLISKKFAEAHSVKERLSESAIYRRFLKPFVKEILSQLTQPQGVDPTDSTTALALTNTDATDTAAEKAKKQRDLQTQKDLKAKEVDADLKNKKQQLQYFKQSVDKLNRFDIPNANKELQSLKSNKI